MAGVGCGCGQRALGGPRVVLDSCLPCQGSSRVELRIKPGLVCSLSRQPPANHLPTTPLPSPTQLKVVCSLSHDELRPLFQVCKALRNTVSTGAGGALP